MHHVVQVCKLEIDGNFVWVSGDQRSLETLDSLSESIIVLEVSNDNK
jgi:hypothetical protein